MGYRAAFMVAFLLRTIYGGMHIVTKDAFNDGMSTSVFVFYRHATAIPFLVPIAFVLERKTAPPLSYKVLLKLFVHALYGITVSINIFSIGLSYASATSSSAISNLLPVLTFFFAVLLRFHGIVKVSGVVFCIAGVTVLAVYKGPELKSFNRHQLFHTKSEHHASVTSLPTATWILGIALMTLGIACWALWTLLQGILVSGIAYYMQVWVIDKSGPLFLSITSPVTLMVTVMLCPFMGEAVALGSVLGGVVMCAGLYCVLWAKRAEEIELSKQMISPVQETEAPFGT